MAPLGKHQRVGEHGIEKRPGDLDAMVLKDGKIEFEVVAGFFRRGGKHLAEAVNLRLEVGDREVPCLVGLPGKCDPEESGGEAVEAGGFNVEAEAGLSLECC